MGYRITVLYYYILFTRYLLGIAVTAVVYFSTKIVTHCSNNRSSIIGRSIRLIGISKCCILIVSCVGQAWPYFEHVFLFFLSISALEQGEQSLADLFIKTLYYLMSKMNGKKTQVPIRTFLSTNLLHILHYYIKIYEDV